MIEHAKTAKPLSKRNYERWIFIGLGLVILTIVGVGYGPKIFLLGSYPFPWYSIIVRVHVVLVNLWLLTLAAQVGFAIFKRIDLHRAFGVWGFRIAAVWALSAVLAWADMLRREADTYEISFILLTRIGLFSIFMIFAYRERRNPTAHKRLIILAMSQAIIGGIFQLPIPFVQGIHPHAYLAALIFPAALISYDLISARKIDPVTLWGSILILIVHFARVPISQSASWLGIAHWIGTLGI